MFESFVNPRLHVAEIESVKRNVTRCPNWDKVLACILDFFFFSRIGTGNNATSLNYFFFVVVLFLGAFFFFRSFFFFWGDPVQLT